MFNSSSLFIRFGDFNHDAVFVIVLNAFFSFKVYFDQFCHWGNTPCNMFVDLATISRRVVEDQIDFFSLYDILFQKQLKKKK